MPELPEVETVCNGLRNLIIGNKFSKVTTFRPNLRIPFPTNFTETIKNKTIIDINRRAKYIQIFLEQDIVLIIHLGMSGKLIAYDAPRSFILPHDHVIFNLNNEKEIVYNDPRRFGLMDLGLKRNLHEHILFKELGPEPLTGDFNPNYLFLKLRNKKQPIKTTLMDNKIAVGVGNIYACESLFKSNISPERAANSLSFNEVESLVYSVKETLEQAIKAGGSTLKDYTTVNGESGYFQHQFLVYGKDNSNCHKCKTTIIKLKQAGRSSYFCPNCQK